MTKLIERQVITTWYTPDEKMPEVGIMVVASVSGKAGNITYDHCLMIAEWYDDGEGWELTDRIGLKNFTVHAWSDLEPYQG